MANQTQKWKGKSGTEYEYTVYPIDQGFKDVAGNYIFAKLVDGRWTPVYIGQTSDLDDRVGNWRTNHHKAACISSQGATHIHAHLSSNVEDERVVEEKDLINNYDPYCNG